MNRVVVGVFAGIGIGTVFSAVMYLFYWAAIVFLHACR